jgi:hypothetical protein
MKSSSQKPFYQIDFLHMPDLILKLYLFTQFLTRYFIHDRQNSTHSSKNNGKDNEFEYNFIKICRYLNLVKH